MLMKIAILINRLNQWLSNHGCILQPSLVELSPEHYHENVTKTKDNMKYTISAGFVSVILLASLYFSAFSFRCNQLQLQKGQRMVDKFSLVINVLFGSARLDYGRYYCVSELNTCWCNPANICWIIFQKFSVRFSIHSGPHSLPQ